ncbi:MAG TPA: YciI family protein [Clostridium sp.]|uniref:YciI family protein n=1 Tax=Clostridium sp. TaxID=1506 RepID=UPI002F93FBF2
MKYFIVEGTFKENMSIKENELQKAIEEHLAFLQKGFDEGFILVSGPKVNVGGGIIIIKGQSLVDIENYLSKDPLKTLGIQEYKIVEFKLHDCQAMLKGWFD